MLIKGLIDEDFVNYKKAAMFISTCYCDWKCCREQGLDISICQNSELSRSGNFEVSADEIFRRYISNPITKAIVFGGLEPFKQVQDIIEVIQTFRTKKCNDDIVIYTGYELSEISKECQLLKQYNNIILKTGRFIPNHYPHFDEILGVKLASDNQKGVILC